MAESRTHCRTAPRGERVAATRAKLGGHPAGRQTKGSIAGPPLHATAAHSPGYTQKTAPTLCHPPRDWVWAAGKRRSRAPSGARAAPRISPRPKRSARGRAAPSHSNGDQLGERGRRVEGGGKGGGADTRRAKWHASMAMYCLASVASTHTHQAKRKKFPQVQVAQQMHVKDF